MGTDTDVDTDTDMGMNVDKNMYTGTDMGPYL
jgi:hypothetical protein